MNELKNKEVIVRKNHQCVWCGEVIEKGSKAQHRIYTFNGDFMDDREHPECYKAMCEAWPSMGSYELENGITPGDYKRGSTKLTEDENK